jgi:hypothetical protein
MVKKKVIKMEEKDIIGLIENDLVDKDSTYVQTEHSILYETLSDYGIPVGGWHSKLWESIFETFMERLIHAGYVTKRSEEEG